MRRRSDRGVTLIEILIALAIIAGLVGLGAGMVGMLGSGEVKSEAVRLKSALRHTYAQAAVNNTSYRIVFDLDEHRWDAEIVNSALIEERRGVDEELEAELMDEEALERAERERAREDLFEEGDDPFGIDRRVSVERVENGLVESGPLRQGVSFDAIYTPDRERRESGKVAINFYPNGYQDPLIIVLRGERGERFSLQTEPLTGRVLLVSEELGPEDGFEGESDD